MNIEDGIKIALVAVSSVAILVVWMVIFYAYICLAVSHLKTKRTALGLLAAAIVILCTAGTFAILDFMSGFLLFRTVY